MKPILKRFFLIWLIGALVLWAFYPWIARSQAVEAMELEEGTQMPSVAPEIAPQPPLSPEQEEWAQSLEMKESGGDPEAINPKDVDGTPSHGCLQFKPGTYSDFSIKYHLASTTDFMNCSQQRTIVRMMILDPDITPELWRYRYFPKSVEELGQHP